MIAKCPGRDLNPGPTKYEAEVLGMELYLHTHAYEYTFHGSKR
jgi:hypothetical protein